MTKAGNSDERERPNEADTDLSAPDRRDHFISSRPPDAHGEWPVLLCVRELANCIHPEEARSPAVILENGGSRQPMCWCGACGAIRFPDDPKSEWTRPGFAQVFADGGCLSDLTDNLRTFAEASASVARAAGALNRDLGPWSEERHAEISTRILVLEDACVELERGARRILRVAGS